MSTALQNAQIWDQNGDGYVRASNLIESIYIRLRTNV